MIKKLKKNWQDTIVQIPDKDIKKGFNDFIDRFNLKLKQKGNKSFYSTTHIYGKLSEEMLETLVELHDRNLPNFQMELLDVAITAIFGYMSTKAWPKKKITKKS
jgi:hypothetical protein